MTKFSQLTTSAIAITALALPSFGFASPQNQHRQDERQTWRILSYVGGAAAILGLVKHDKNLTMIGAAGALYSVYRLSQDKDSRDPRARQRAAYYSKPYVDIDGYRYNRKTVNKGGHKYYQFVRGSKVSTNKAGHANNGRRSHGKPH